MNLYYMRETGKSILACVSNENAINMVILGKNFNYEEKTNLEVGESNNGFSIVYSYDFNNYFIISNRDSGSKNSSQIIHSLQNITLIEGRINNITYCIRKPNKTEDEKIISSTLLSSLTTHLSTIVEMTTTFLVDSTILSTEPKLSTIITIQNNIHETIPKIKTLISTTYLIDSTILLNEPKLLTVVSIDSSNFSNLLKISSTSQKPYNFITTQIFNIASSSLMSQLSKDIIIEEYIETKREDIISEIPTIIQGIEIGQIP